jgi:hypothetical protein
LQFTDVQATGEAFNTQKRTSSTSHKTVYLLPNIGQEEPDDVLRLNCVVDPDPVGRIRNFLQNPDPE